jgi:hypothetical protein
MVDLRCYFILYSDIGVNLLEIPMVENEFVYSFLRLVLTPTNFNKFQQIWEIEIYNVDLGQYGTCLFAPSVTFC